MPETPLYSSTIPAPTPKKSTKIFLDKRVNNDQSFLNSAFFPTTPVFDTHHEMWWTLNSVMCDVNVFGLMLSVCKVFILMPGFYCNSV